MPGRNDESDASGGPAAEDAADSLKAEFGSLSEQISQLDEAVHTRVSSHKKKKSGGTKEGAAVRGNARRCRGIRKC